MTTSSIRAKALLVIGCLAFLFAAAPGSASAAGVDKCYSCHRDVGDTHAAGYAGDVHFGKGISCADCHGGDRQTDDMQKAMDPARGFVGKIKKTDIPTVCGKCHDSKDALKSYGSNLPYDIVQQYQRSVHGQKLAGGDQTMAQCVTCHGVHGIKKVTDPASPVYALNIPKLCSSCHANAAYMKDHDPAFPIDQYEKYQTSVHGKLNAKGDPKAATCISCHNPHEIISGKFPLSSVYPSNIPQTCARCHSNADYMKAYNIPTDQYQKYVGSVHGKALLEKKDNSAPACNSCHGNHGAAPPGVASISNICGTCHALNADLFDQSPHKKAFDDAKMPGCETCHSNHGVQPASADMLGVGEGAVCAQCHSSGDKGYQVAAAMRSSLDSLTQIQAEADTAVRIAEQRGMEVSEAKFALKDVRQAVIQSRTVVHSLSLPKFREVVGKGHAIAATSLEEGKEAQHEYYFRRTGLGVATLIISVLASAIYIKLRRRERNQGKA